MFWLKSTPSRRSAKKAATLPPPSSLHLVVLGLNRVCLLTRLRVILLVLGAASALLSILALATVHPAIAVGITTTSGVLIMVPAVWLTMLGKAVLMLGMVVLTMVLLGMLRMLNMALMLRGGRCCSCP